MGTGEFNAGGNPVIGYPPNQGGGGEGGQILLVASFNRNQR